MFVGPAQTSPTLYPLGKPVGVHQPLSIGHEEADGTVSLRHDVPSNALDAKWAFGGAPKAIDAEGLPGGIEVIDAVRGGRAAMGGANKRW